MVQSSINRGVIKQKIGLWGEGKWWKKSCIQGLFVKDSGVSAIFVGGEYELPLVLFFLLFITMKEWKNKGDYARESWGKYPCSRQPFVTTQTDWEFKA